MRLKGYLDSRGEHMLSYWNHLATNSRHLDESSARALKEIESLTQLRDSLRSTLASLTEIASPAQSSDPEIASLESLLSARTKSIEPKESLIASMEKLEIAALNAYSRIVFMVAEAMGTPPKGESVSEQFENCALCMEKMLESIVKAKHNRGDNRS